MPQLGSAASWVPKVVNALDLFLFHWSTQWSFHWSIHWKASQKPFGQRVRQDSDEAMDVLSNVGVRSVGERNSWPGS